ncbi:MAG: glycosyltransferase family 4 protein [Bacteroidales bacterium]|nr:glycosyltransferase family 4 protein [Bacteroidales bacterium]
MKIAVNTRLLLKDKLEGIGWFTFETLKRIVRQHPEHTFYFIFDRPYDESFVFAPNVVPVKVFPPARHPYLWYLYFEWGVTRLLKQLQPDLFLSTDGWLSLRTNVPTVDVIHDLNFEHYPEFIKPVVRRYYKRFFHRFAQKAARIATVSEYTRQDINKLYGVSLDKIDVVYNGSSSLYLPIDEDAKKSVKAEYSSGCDYFLFVGLIHQRKNLANEFRAFDRYKQSDTRNMKFVVVGDKKWWHGEIEDAYLAMAHKEDVIFLGRQPQEALSRLMAAATALVYASFFEGFGIPILEAFNAETAVITSNVTSMPEVAGDAALLVNPHSVDDICAAMTRLAEDETLRQELIAKGREQRQRFSWDRTAAALWQTVEKVLAEI